MYKELYKKEIGLLNLELEQISHKLKIEEESSENNPKQVIELLNKLRVLLYKFNSKYKNTFSSNAGSSSYLCVEPTLHIKKNDDIYHFVLDDLLPKRHYGKKAKEIMLEEHVIEASGYYMGLQQYIQTHGKPDELYREDLTLLIVNMYKDLSKVMDCDNVEPKLFIDTIIKQVFIQDDGRHLNLIFDHAMTENQNHTELFLGRKKDIANLYIKDFVNKE